MKPGQLIEFYHRKFYAIMPSNLEEIKSKTMLVVEGAIGMAIEAPIAKYHLVRVLVGEQIVFAEATEIRIYVENGFKEMLKRAGIKEEE